MYIEAQLAALGPINWSKDVDTAGVNDKGLFINPLFWDTLNAKEKDFLIDHEMLHLILNHHSRLEHSLIGNMAADLAINSELLKRYKKEEIPNLYSTGFFPEKIFLPDGMTSEWYLEAIKNQYSQPIKKTGWGGDLNRHGQKLEQKLTGIKNGLLAGTDEHCNWIKKEDKPHRQVRRFEEIINETCQYSTRNIFGFDLTEKWGRPNRNYSAIKSDFQMPGQVYAEDEFGVKKLKILLFMDVSGSVARYVPWIIAAGKMINEKVFSKKSYVFATYCHEFNFKGSIPNVGGGTDFRPFVQVAEKEKYDMAWVFTDGAGTEINIPEAAREKWHWFLTPKMITNLIPKKCNIHFLSKFVLPKGS